MVVTSLIAVTSAWNTEQQSGSLKDEWLIISCGKLLVVVRKPAPTSLSVREPVIVLSEDSLMSLPRSSVVGCVIVVGYCNVVIPV